MSHVSVIEQLGKHEMLFFFAFVFILSANSILYFICLHDNDNKNSVIINCALRCQLLSVAAASQGRDTCCATQPAPPVRTGGDGDITLCWKRCGVWSIMFWLGVLLLLVVVVCQECDTTYSHELHWNGASLKHQRVFTAHDTMASKTKKAEDAKWRGALVYLGDGE